MCHQTHNTSFIAESSDDDDDDIDEGVNDKAYQQFKSLLRSSSLAEVQIETHKLMPHLSLGKAEKGATTGEQKVKSRNERWYNQKPVKKTNDSEISSDLFLRRDSFIKLEMKRGNGVEHAHYRVLSLFTKFNNKWFISEEAEFPWVNDRKPPRKGRVLVRLLKQIGDGFKEVDLETNGSYGPHHIFRTVPFDKIISVEGDLVDM